MANRSSNAPDAIDTVATPADGRLAPQILTMFRAFMASPQRNKIVLLGVALVAVIGTTAFGQVKLNAWNRPFYDALAHKDMGEFLIQLRVFVVIAAGLLVLNVAQAWLNQATKVGLRKGLVRDLLEEWLRPRRAFRLVDAGEIGANPDQRIHEDARHLTELSADLGIGLLQSSTALLDNNGAPRPCRPPHSSDRAALILRRRNIVRWWEFQANQADLAALAFIVETLHI